MAAKGQAWAFRSGWLVLALAAVFGVYEVWDAVGVRVRPWRLEASLESGLAECWTDPEISCFGEEYRRLVARSEEAKSCLGTVDRTWAIWRDYSDCIPRLLSACTEAHLLRLKLALRRREQDERLRVLLATLTRELASNAQDGTQTPRPAIRSIEQGRARSLTDQAKYLRAQGEVGSALEAALRGWASLRNYNHLVDKKFARFQDRGLREEWDRQASELLQWTKERDRRAILIGKLEHRCLVLNSGQVEKSYPANLSRNWYARKLQEHDAATPEGVYKIVRLIAAGRYGRALLLDYPNAADRERFAALKRSGDVHANARMGGSVEIHGAGRPDSDWTDGCVSLNNHEMQDLYRYAYRGMPVTIVGTSRLTSTQRDETIVSR